MRLLYVFTAWAVCLSLFGCSPKRECEDVFTVRFLDVGQGDCTLLQTPQGNILIDAGTEDSQELLCLRLAELGVRELMLAVFTHFDEDHIGGADGILSRFAVRTVWVNGEIPNTPAGKLLRAAAQEQGTAVEIASLGTLYQLGALHLAVMAPQVSSEKGGNEDSIVLRVQYGDVSAIFSGDVGLEQEEKMVQYFGASHFDCDLYKVGHHGSKNASGDVFLRAMTPAYAVIGCGAGNSFGHPTGEALARIEACGAQVLRTDLLGEIVFVSDGKSLQWQD